MTSAIVLDLETKFSFQDVANDLKKLGVSLVGIYKYDTLSYESFTEKDFSRLFTILEASSQIIGFNILKFDMPVLAPYYVGDLSKFPVLDLLDDVQRALGFRVSLDDLAKETLGEKKNGHGLLAIEYYRSGQMDKLREYCLHDVAITQKLYEYGKKEGKVFFKTAYGRREIPVFWKDNKSPADIPLTLPF